MAAELIKKQFSLLRRIYRVLDSLDEIRSTFTARPSAMVKASWIVFSELELSFCFFSSGKREELSEEDIDLVFLLTVKVSLSINGM